MAVLSNNRQRPMRATQGGQATRSLPMAGYTNFGGSGNTAHTIYKGSVVVSDVSDTDGYFRAMPLSSSVNMAAGDIFGGIADERQDVNSDDAADGSVDISVIINGTWGFAKGSIGRTDMGADIYASDDDTITTTSSNNMYIGILVDVDATHAWVDISHAAGRLNAAIS